MSTEKLKENLRTFKNLLLILLYIKLLNIFYEKKKNLDSF